MRCNRSRQYLAVEKFCACVVVVVVVVVAISPLPFPPSRPDKSPIEKKLRLIVPPIKAARYPARW